MNKTAVASDRRPSGWLGQASRFTAIETALYLRDNTAIFWTFIYPVMLLVILMIVFGGGQARFFAEIDVEGTGPGADRFAQVLQGRFDAISPESFSLRRVTAKDTTPEGRVRVIIPVGLGEGARPGGEPISVRLVGEPGAESGSMLSIVSETAALLDLEFSRSPEIVSIRYDIGSPKRAAESRSAVYYVIGLAVLTMVSTALFGFSGPLIDLRARGGLKLLSVMPVRRTAFLAGFAMCRVAILVVFVSAFIAGGLLVYAGVDALRATAPLTMLSLIVAGSVAFLAAGLALAGVVTSNTLASAVINFVNLPIMFLSDLFIPLDIMPEVVRTIAQFSPVYLLVDAMRQAAVGEAASGDWIPAMVALAALFVVSIAIIASTFRWRLPR